ncbi:ATP-dependent helicase HepA [Alteromonadaceae bacterium Bs31]|nr:ATP-dependent helicase HepA [Alteromonadaceae bacterium Bs31]
MTSEFVPGQRWVIDSEPELGLGIVTAVQGRTITLFFEQAEAERNYATAQAPLTRIQFAVDDEITLADGSRTIARAVHEQDGLVFYQTDDGMVAETQLSSEISLRQPLVALLTGQLDAPKWFYFRRKLDGGISRTWQSRLGGLLGVRANLIPHQLYVAWMACEREKVRVLLADEVGLGKTIEAGMILSRLLKFERVQRTLILVPDALQVQWLVELVRKFSLTPSLYSGEEHDFINGQVHIVPHSALAAESERLLTAEFELTIVDEAHHLLPATPEFQCLDMLSQLCDHLVLLTATPEQLGEQSHFARLRLLDPAKFTSLDELHSQEQHYQQLNQQIRELPASRDWLLNQYKLDSSNSDEELVDQLLDVHGMGRVMFRNVRSAIKGFPQRVAHAHLLEDDHWDTKFEWLANWIKQQGDEKILVICHSIEQVKDCESYLWQKHGIDAALFHEEQNLIDRDKAAAYFADKDQGSQLLICSEIGSEGRNFQFSCHLVCMDLPEHPDLLEQRIGRLDRIGQNRNVNIHIPQGENGYTAQQFFWFHQVLRCIEEQNPAAGQVHDEIYQGDNAFFSETTFTDDFVEQAKTKVNTLQLMIQEGRDALLEMNSCRQPFADELTDKISLFEKESPFELVETASDLLNFHFEGSHQGTYSLIPSDKMLIPALPGIPPEGSEVTFSRDIANHREDLIFLTWDSPFISGLWEMIHHSSLGVASVATLPNRQLPAGHCLLEVCFDLSVQSPLSAQCLPFLSEHSVRALVLDISDKNLAPLLSEQALQDNIQAVKKHLAREVVNSRKDEIRLWFKKAEAFAEQESKKLRKQAAEHARHFYEVETERLISLAAAIGNEADKSELQRIQERSEAIVEALNSSTLLQLSAVRLMVITD